MSHNRSLLIASAALAVHRGESLANDNKFSSAKNGTVSHPFIKIFNLGCKIYGEIVLCVE